MLNFGLEDKVAVITGTASGIGKATAVMFAELGARLALLDVNADGVETVAKEIRARGCDCRYYGVDITDAAAMDNSFDLILSYFSRIDILVNVAGIWESVPFLQMKQANLERMMSINLTGCFNCIKRVLPNMVERRYGKIISVASTVGKVGSGLGSSHYAASKGALLALTYSLAKEYGAYGININAVAPGPIDTGISQLLGERAIQEYTKSTALKRIGKPEEVAAVIAFLASDSSSYVTGQAWDVSGGM